MKSATTTSVKIEDPTESFKEFLISKGLRVTNQRIVIFDAAFAMSEHFTAEDLLEKSRKLDPSVSRATVYRALPVLTESGLIREVDVGHDNKYYLAIHCARTFQAQVVCVDCDKIFEVDAPFMEWYGKTVCDKLEMKAETQRLQVSAQCTELHKCGKCKRSGQLKT